MALYHLSAKAIRRKDGRSSVAAAAYRSGECIVDERRGLEHDYTRKGGVLHAELCLPGGGTADRSDFWNRVEKHHRRGDAVVAREVEVSLPHEFDNEQRRELALAFARELADRYGVAVDVALHAPRPVSDRDLEKNPQQFHMTDPDTGKRHNGNWHAHLLMTACHVDPDGTLAKKVVELDPIHCQRHKIENMTDRERGRWADLQNAALEQTRSAVRVDNRSYADRGSDQVPTIHLGGYAERMRREGTPELSENATLNAEITAGNEEVSALREQLSHESAEQHISARHQLQICADLRQLYATQQRIYDEREAQAEAEWQAWLERPEVCSATGRIITELYVDACIERERALPQNQPSAPQPLSAQPPQTQRKAKPEAQAPQQAAGRAAKEAWRISMMATQGEREEAIRAASRDPDLSYFDSLCDALEARGIGALGEMKPTPAPSPASLGTPSLDDWSPGNNGPGL